MIDFENYIQVLRRKYHPCFVEKSFYKALEYIGGIPKDNERFVLVSVNLDKKTNGWQDASGSMNSFEWIFNRKMLRRGMRPEKGGMMKSVKSIEMNDDEGGYHWHILIRLNRLRAILSDDELEYIICNIANDLDETNSQDPTTAKTKFFKYDASKLNTSEDAFGTELHYLCKQASSKYRPLINMIFPKRS